MSLVQDFCESVSVRLAGVAFAVASLTGCQALPKSNAEIAGIPVGRVVTQSINRDILDLKKGAAAAIKPNVRFRACPNETGIPTGTVGKPCPSRNQRNDGVEPRPTLE